jgi:hypothetical protein
LLLSDEILKKCGGLPLAIIAVSSIITSRPTRTRVDWENIRNSLYCLERTGQYKF